MKELLKTAFGGGDGNDDEAKEFRELRTIINDALGLSETDQRTLQKRQLVLEQIEQDREGHKILREECWRRRRGETIDEEFVSLMHQVDDFSPEKIKLAKCNAVIFMEVNGIKEKKTKALIIHIDQAIYDHERWCSSRDAKTRHAAQDLEACIRRIAKTCFFYRDLRDFQQPHARYYRADDDGRKLRDYDFEADELARHVRGNKKALGDGKFYRERAYRYRVALERYERIDRLNSMSSEFPDPQSCVDLIDKDLNRECRRILRELEEQRELAEYLWYLRRIVKDFPSVGGLYFVSGEHLSIALARLFVLQVNHLIPCRNIYSTTKFDIDWVLGDIASNNPNMDFTVVARSTLILEAAIKVY